MGLTLRRGQARGADTAVFANTGEPFEPLNSNTGGAIEPLPATIPGTLLSP